MVVSVFRNALHGVEPQFPPFSFLQSKNAPSFHRQVPCSAAFAAKLCMRCPNLMVSTSNAQVQRHAKPRQPARHALPRASCMRASPGTFYLPGGKFRDSLEKSDPLFRTPLHETLRSRC